MVLDLWQTPAPFDFQDCSGAGLADLKLGELLEAYQRPHLATGGGCRGRRDAGGASDGGARA